jgi:polysaccharide biosynthesis protein PslH
VKRESDGGSLFDATPQRTVKILFVCHRLPYPPNRGGKIRPFNLINHLSQKHSVVVASLAHTEPELREGMGLKQYCEELIAEVVPNRMRWFRAFKSLPTRTPSSLSYFWSPRLHTRIQDKSHRTNFDVVFAHCAFMAPYVMNIRTAFRVMDFGDLDSAKWAEYSKWKPFPSSHLYALEAGKLRAYERSIARRVDHCTVTTQGEKDEFETLGVSTPSTVIPNGVDTSYFSPLRYSSDSATTIVFTGRMDYFPNIDGVCYFVHEILPLIREKMPNIEFRIIGSNPSRKVRDLAKKPGISVTGHVPDVRPYVHDAAVMVAPVRIARGTQNKILESMSMGIPVVATPQAAKGVQAVPGKHLLVAQEPAVFAQYVVELLTNRSLRRSLAGAARQQIEKMHLWPVSMRVLDDVLNLSTASDNRHPAGPVLSR